MRSTVQCGVQAAAVSHAGRRRRVNQDAWSYSVEQGVFVVCDGMGGAAGGEIASQLAADAFIEFMGLACEEKRTHRELHQAIGAANTRVFHRAAEEPALRGMGTTLVALATRSRGRVAIAHVGDSRCYLLRAGELRGCTADHSIVAEQLRMGVLSPEQAVEAPLQHVITRAIGTRRSVDAEVRTIETQPNDLFLLCTDGLTRELPEAAIGVILRRPFASLIAQCQALLEAALEAGGRDNITCLLVAVR